MDYSKFIQDLNELVSIESVLDTPTENAPFGKENKRALEVFLSKAKEFGFETINYDNYGGEIYYGEGEEVGIVGHLDIVPLGSGWITDPLKVTEVDGVLHGRGVEDDKGPTLLCLYALKELKDEGVKFNRKIRLIVGCNEETGWKDIEYIKTKTSFPKYGFSPDSNFPVCYAEKGIYHLKIKLPTFKNFKNLKGGSARNAVCAYATVEVNEKGINTNLLKKYGLKLQGNLIESFGVAAHGSHPEQGKNAFYPLLKYLEEMGEELFDLPDLIFKDGIGLASFNNEQGLTTLSPNIVNIENGKLVLTCDIRIPAPLSIKDIEKNLTKIKQDYEIIERHPPFMADKNSWLVEALLDAYNDVTGENAKPVYLCGSTFARCFEVGCGFGFGDDERGYTKGCHTSYEGVTVEHLKKSYEIYKKAIYNLVK